MAFPYVFEPLPLRHRTPRSRITFSAHTANMAEDGLPGERHISYCRERALGGPGMIVVGLPFHLIGDAVAPRRASLAFLDGRTLGLRLGTR